MTLHRKLADGSYLHMDALPDKERASNYLQAATLREIVKCNCCGSLDLARDVGMHLRMGRAVAAKMPLDGPNHRFPCPRHTKTAQALAERGYSGEAIKQDRNGVNTVRPAFQAHQAKLVLPPESDRGVYVPLSPGQVKQPQPKVTLLGLACMLLEAAGHHVHDPSRAMDAYARWALVRNAAMYVRFPKLPNGRDANGTNWNLANYLLLPTDLDGRWRANNHMSLLHAGKFAPLAIAHLTAEDIAVDDRHIDLSHVFGVHVVLPRAKYQDACARFRSGESALVRGFSVATMFLLRVEFNEGAPRAIVEQMVMMPITNSGVPVWSLREREFFAELESLDRCFRTNLIYDEHEYDRKRPDGWLMDVGCEAPVEVFGRDDPIYVTRMLEKISKGIARYGEKFVYWTALSEDLSAAILRLPARA